MSVDVSIVVPVRNEGDNIGALVDDLRKQTRAAAEILIVDAGSTDDTVARVEAHARGDARIRVIRLTHGYPGAGRNAGLRQARSPWVAFIDAGIRVDADWLRLLMEPIDRGGGGAAAVDVVLGGFEPLTARRDQRAAALAFVPARRATPDGDSNGHGGNSGNGGGSDGVRGQWRGFFVASSAVRLETALSVGGFIESLRSGEDLLFFERLQAQRARIAYAPAAVAHWTQASTPGAVWRRFRTYAEHSLRAGLRRDWFDVVARRYALMLATGPAFPVAAAGLLLARAAVMQRRKPEFVDDNLAGRAAQLVEVALLLGVIDAATWAAWLSWKRTGAVTAASPRSPPPPAAVGEPGPGR